MCGMECKTHDLRWFEAGPKMPAGCLFWVPFSVFIQLHLRRFSDGKGRPRCWPNPLGPIVFNLCVCFHVNWAIVHGISFISVFSVLLISGIILLFLFFLNKGWYFHFLEMAGCPSRQFPHLPGLPFSQWAEHKTCRQDSSCCTRFACAPTFNRGASGQTAFFAFCSTSTIIDSSWAILGMSLLNSAALFLCFSPFSRLLYPVRFLLFCLIFTNSSSCGTSPRSSVHFVSSFFFSATAAPFVKSLRSDSLAFLALASEPLVAFCFLLRLGVEGIGKKRSHQIESRTSLLVALPVEFALVS